MDASAIFSVTQSMNLLATGSGASNSQQPRRKSNQVWTGLFPRNLISLIGILIQSDPGSRVLPEHARSRDRLTEGTTCTPPDSDGEWVAEGSRRRGTSTASWAVETTEVSLWCACLLSLYCFGLDETFPLNWVILFVYWEESVEMKISEDQLENLQTSNVDVLSLRTSKDMAYWVG